MKLAAVALLMLALTPAQERGRQIYFRGESASPQGITATVGEGGTPFSAAIVPCVNCHGEDGRGRVEANVRPPHIPPGMLARTATVSRLGPVRLRVVEGPDQGKQYLHTAGRAVIGFRADCALLLSG